MTAETLRDLNLIAQSIERSGQFLDAAARGLSPVRNPVVDAMEMSAVIHGALAWALKEAAQSGDIAPVAELADLASEWLLDRRVGVPGLTVADLVKTDPAAN